MQAPVLSVVIPTRHEAATIGTFIDRVRHSLAGIPIEIVVVDDSDADDTPGVLQRKHAEVGNSLVVLHRARGSVPDRTLGTAVVDGIRLSRGEFVCVIDADGQHPPEVVPELLATARRTGADYVGGSRYLPGGSAEGLGGHRRKVISLGLALVARCAFLLTPVGGMTDPLSGFFLFRRQLVDGVKLQPVGWKISLEVLIRGRAQRTAEVPYVFARRFDDVSKATMSQGLLVLRHMLILLASLTGLRRFVAFALVGVSGMAVNTGTLLALAALGFNPLTWPIWAAAEAAILWNYNLNRHITWGDRPYGRWWVYNIAALIASLIAISVTTLLLLEGHVPLVLASMAGIVVGMVLNYLVFDNVVFSGLSWVSLRLNLPLVEHTRRNARG